MLCRAGRRGGVPLQYRARAADHRLAHETILHKDNRVMSTVEQQVKAIVAEQLGVKAEQVTNDASFVDDLGADSLDTVELVMALEEEFEIEIPDEDAEKIDGPSGYRIHQRASHQGVSSTWAAAR